MLEDPFLQALAAKIREWSLGDIAASKYAVAFSGGLDSTLLLTAICRLGIRDSLRALHIDHALHPQSGTWETHCRATAQSLGVGYESARVDVRVASGLGVEAAAREARYHALAQLLLPGEILLTAHHGDDQLETVLFRMLRGSGVRGLRGIVEVGRFGRGYLARPLLGFSKAELHAHAQRWQLCWLEDPANQSIAHDRSLLRLQIIPKLRERWPAAPRMAQRLAQQMADAEEILEAMAVHDARNLASVDRVPRVALATLAPSRQRNLLRHLIREAGLPMPSARQLENLRESLLAARPDAQTRIRWPGGEGRVYRDCLYLFEPLPVGSSADYQTGLVTRSRWSGPEGCIGFEPIEGPGLPQSWLDAGLTLRFRVGGERFQPLNRAASLPLKRWLQHEGVLPWMRGRIPLLYRGERLVAVADVWVDEAVRAAPAEPRWRVSWTEHPPIR
ncbi:MAG TPA: tRNA lysidine(34) synthetase TilS [Gammaproteobacteria bacterium]|nr:tRNA lysidine(34) synthetase TilS [Gammaproteobacteria bacterium]